MKFITESDLKELIEEAFHEGFKAASDVLATIAREKVKMPVSGQSSKG